MIDRGSGETVVLSPGIQGRWQWMTNAIDAFADLVVNFARTHTPYTVRTRLRQPA